MLRINQIKIPIFDIGAGDNTEKELGLVAKKAAAMLKCSLNGIRKLRIVRRSVDARDKDCILFVYSVNVRLHDSIVGPSSETEAEFVQRLHNRNVTQLEPYTPVDFKNTGTGGKTGRPRPVVIGSGPCGMFAALGLAESGLRPVVLERGDNADRRLFKTELFLKGGKLDPDSNMQFGEGGAGTFSDGKLNTSIKDPGGYIDYVLRAFVRFGADESILTDQKPHIGTDVLVGIIKNIRKHIESLGGTYIFNARFDGIDEEDGRLTGVRYTDTTTGKSSLLGCESAVLATGHSARDVFLLLNETGLELEAKPFAVGVRVQHPQELIDGSLYGKSMLKEKQEILGPASYKLTHRTASGRSCYSFCMCPGGHVINSSSEEGRLCINGMSYNDRASGTANSALIVNVTARDCGEFTGTSDALSGVRLQEMLEKKAYQALNGVIPYETLAEFRAHSESPSGESRFEPCFKGYAAAADVRSLLPEFVGDAIDESMDAFGRVIKGFDSPDTIVAGIESRTSSPVRIKRDESREATRLKGLYPAGEGAGYAGGIMSAAIDGIKTAQQIIKLYS